jgi:RNA 3'-terminal phosphate cyclase (ATP)
MGRRRLRIATGPGLHIVIRVRVIDGSYGEGGGQLLRNAVALAALTGTAVRVHSIRAKRDPPGLAPQHLAAVRAVAELAGARCEGLTLRSSELSFTPGSLRHGEFAFDVGTAGSVVLVLQALLPLVVTAGAPYALTVVGGTDIRAAPPLDYLRAVLLPLLAGMGAHAQLATRRRGYYPRGGGLVELTTAPSKLRPLRVPAAGRLLGIAGLAHVAHLPADIAARMRRAALAELAAAQPAPTCDTAVLGDDAATGRGGAIVLWAQHEHSTLGAGRVAERGVPAEALGAAAGAELAADLASGASVDTHAADQLLIYCALARGESCFTTRVLSPHARTAIWLIEQFLPVRYAVTADGARTSVSVRSEGWP